MLNVKHDFPILNQTIHAKPLVYLDSSASSQKPKKVIDTINHYYAHEHANVHRGVYELSVRATRAYEDSRKKVQAFINAKQAHEIIFTRGTTESINLVAQSYAKKYLKPNDEIIISTMEHHSNIVPWQLLREQYHTQIKVIPLLDSGELDIDAYQQLFTANTKMVAISHASNVLGTINPLRLMIDIAHQQGVPVLVDGAQALPHMPVDVQALDCDFYAFSSHKMYGPTGVGVLYGKTKWLDAMPPYQGGGDMIETVTFEQSTYAKLPAKFEAGTPPIAGVIGLGAAIDYLQALGMQAVFEHEQALLDYATEKLGTISGLRFIGTAVQKVGVISFTLDGIHPHDIATILDREGIAVRAGHHCAMPLMKRFAIPACTRASFGIYNTLDDINCLVAGIESVQKVFK